MNGITQPLIYTPSSFIRTRRKTHEVKVGDVGIGGNNPIRIQSMTTSDTMDTLATVNQVRKLIDVGCEIVRITAPSIKDAENLKNIKDEMKRQGLHVPLVADIHFTPNAAMKAAEFVEKVRVNPGNYADRKKFEVRDYTESEYQEALDYIHEKLSPLVLKCKENGVAMRIGTNHGSLSDRIMNRFGDTPEGMVESALEFLRICELHSYNQVLISMKSSNTQVMIQAYRLLVSRMNELGMTYPLHLGVTEAGDGEDGRIKSAIGIGSLLEDGIGDTIRVSLTEDAWYEIPVAKAIAAPYNVVAEKKYEPVYESETFRTAMDFTRKESDQIKGNRLNLGEKTLIRAGIKLESVPEPEAFMTLLEEHGAITFTEEPKLEFISFSIKDELDVVALYQVIAESRKQAFVPEFCISVPNFDLVPAHLPYQIRFVEVLITEQTTLEEILRYRIADRNLILTVKQGNWNWHERLEEIVSLLKENGIENILISGTTDDSVVSFYRELIEWKAQTGNSFPLVLQSSPELLSDDAVLRLAVELGGLLADGFGDLVLVGGNGKVDDRRRVIFNILQAARQRTTKTEYISCPSCGRTLFNLQETTERIKSQTSHLKGVKIAIMGCIVNGPGEMADADFGYVGSGPGKIDLYVGKTVVRKSIPQEMADATLIDLIKEEGKWVEANG
ncbi:MAG: (E)-4-hydroxy-3-methylbut-2-enyl-diphosphate synthase [Bacteroidetes bacterium]|nr:(E)-4-hydroxy-3-methylbut-2-enyl-diphosphate synthase [Bacteroidota bacterium]